LTYDRIGLVGSSAVAAFSVVIAGPLS
jgi:hypothetical protein